MLMGKLGMLLAAGAGYVLGTRHGRERYEQIRHQAQRLWSDPRVQESKAKVQQVAQQKGKEVQGTVRDKLSGAAGEEDQAASSGDGSPVGQSPVAGARHPDG